MWEFQYVRTWTPRLESFATVRVTTRYYSRTHDTLRPAPRMKRDLGQLASDSFDVLVIGGGIYGLTAAYEAAQRGLRVALVERRDFGSGTSFNHHKTLHGGLRYLQTADLARMRESIGERRAFARIAPQLVSPQAFVMPTLARLERSRLAMQAAFLADQAIGMNRNSGVPESHHLPPGR